MAMKQKAVAKTGAKAKAAAGAMKKAAAPKPKAKSTAGKAVGAKAKAMGKTKAKPKAGVASASSSSSSSSSGSSSSASASAAKNTSTGGALTKRVLISGKEFDLAPLRESAAAASVKLLEAAREFAESQGLVSESNKLSATSIAAAGSGSNSWSKKLSKSEEVDLKRCLLLSWGGCGPPNIFLGTIPYKKYNDVKKDFVKYVQKQKGFQHLTDERKLMGVFNDAMRELLVERLNSLSNNQYYF